MLSLYRSSLCYMILVSCWPSQAKSTPAGLPARCPSRSSVPGQLLPAQRRATPPGLPDRLLHRHALSGPVPNRQALVSPRRDRHRPHDHPWPPCAREQSRLGVVASAQLGHGLAMRHGWCPRDCAATRKGAESVSWFVQAVPHLDGTYYWDPTSCTIWSLTQGGCVASMPRSYVEAVQQRVRDAQERIVTHTYAKLLDLRDALCPSDTCSVEPDGALQYLDGDHISAVASLRLAPLIAESITQTSAG